MRCHKRAFQLLRFSCLSTSRLRLLSTIANVQTQTSSFPRQKAFLMCRKLRQQESNTFFLPICLRPLQQRICLQGVFTPFPVFPADFLQDFMKVVDGQACMPIQSAPPLFSLSSSSSNLHYSISSTSRLIHGKDNVERIVSSKVCCSAYPAESQPPLTKGEEYQCFADVQDLIALEKNKLQLESELGRTPSYQEWADHAGCSIYLLYARIGKGRAAKRKMIAANLPLVSSIAKQFHGCGLCHQELCQEGAKGLMRSTEKFDISYNTKFSTYSYYWIRERMSIAVEKLQSMWRVRKSLQSTVTAARQPNDKSHELDGRTLSMSELSAATGIEKTTVSSIKPRQTLFLKRSSRTAFWNTYDNDGKQSKEAEDPQSDLPWRAVWRSELRTEFEELFHTLTPRELQVLRMRYGLCGAEPLRLTQIADSLNVTHETVRKAEKNALSKLKKAAVENGLQHYLSDIPN